MKMSEARIWLKTAAANAGDKGNYDDASLDQAVITLGDDMARATQLTCTISTLTLTAAVASLPAMDASFRRERRVDVPYLTGSNLTLDAGSIVTEGQRRPQLQVWTPDQLDEQQARFPSTTGQPIAVCFDTPTTGRVYPVPDLNYTLLLPWRQPFVSLAAATAGGGWLPGVPLIAPSLSGTNLVLTLALGGGGSGWSAAPTLSFAGGAGSGGAATATAAGGRVTAVNVTNAGSYTVAPNVLASGYCANDRDLLIPDEYFRQGLVFGGTAILQFSDLKRRFGSSNWQRYQEFLAGISGTGAGPVQRRLVRRR